MARSKLFCCHTEYSTGSLALLVQVIFCTIKRVPPPPPLCPPAPASPLYFCTTPPWLPLFTVVSRSHATPGGQKVPVHGGVFEVRHPLRQRAGSRCRRDTFGVHPDLRVSSRGSRHDVARCEPMLFSQCFCCVCGPAHILGDLSCFVEPPYMRGSQLFV